ncbi:Uncharacterised protein [Legionella maceachernii]|nr:Uncharacterised protein [Legionella maceachernii]
MISSLGAGVAVTQDFIFDSPDYGYACTQATVLE